MVSGQKNVPLAPYPAQIKLLWDEARDKTVADCAGLDDIVVFADRDANPFCENANSCSFKASTSETDPADFTFEPSGNIIHFNDGGQQGERVRFERSGYIAVCYCGTMADGSGSQPAGECLQEYEKSYWILMARTMIRGPCLISETGTCIEQECYTVLYYILI